MAVSWSGREGSSEARVGIDPGTIKVSADGATAAFQGAGVYLDAKYSINDTVSVKGTGDGWSDFTTSYGWDSTGSVRVRSVTGTTVALIYGATKTATMKVVVSGTYWGSDITKTVTVSFPARAYALPSAPTGCVVVRGSDVQHTISWVNHASTAGPYTNVFVERQTDGGTWVQIASLAGAVTSFVDKTTSVNHQYSWRVRAKNATGYSGYATSGVLRTTPATPGTPSVSKSGTQISIGWVSSASYASGFEIRHAANGVWDANPITTVAGTARGWTHTNADVTKTHQYQVRANTTGPALSSAWSGSSDVVQLAAPPAAPKVMVSAERLDTDLQPLMISWVHQPVDSTAQTAAQLRWRQVGASAWTTIQFVAQTLYTFPAGTPANGGSYEVQVCTRGDYNAYGPWSASMLVVCSQIPQCSIQAPGPDVTTAQIQVVWSFFDPDGTAQAGWRVTLLDADGLTVYQISGSGDTPSHDIGYELADETSYTVVVAVGDGAGLWSQDASQPILVAYPPVVTPLLDAVWDEDRLAVDLTLTAPLPAEGEDPAVLFGVEWLDDKGLWRPIAQNLPVPGPVLDDDGNPITEPSSVGVTDLLAGFGQVTYRALTVSALGSISTASVVVDTPTSWFAINAGPRYELLARVRANPKRRTSRGIERVLHQFEGNQFPTEFTGTAIKREWSLSATIARDLVVHDGDLSSRISSRQSWDVVAEVPGPVWARMPDGTRVFVSLGVVSISDDWTRLAGLDVSMTEVMGS